MNNQKILITVVFLLLTGATAGLILHANAHQRLGDPGVRTQPLPGTRNLKVLLPEQLPGYSAEVTTQANMVVAALPDDTSFGRCVYTAPDGFQTCANAVLMGTDRSSIHKPQVCLTGQGWKIDDSAQVEKIHMQQPVPYDLPVMHLTATLNTEAGGQARVFRGVYVYWFVDGSKLTAEHWQRMWWMAKDMLLTGVLDRFSYIAYFSVCAPGQEDETFERMRKVIVESVPKFQLVPRMGAPGAKS
jgi:hypothetical protein